MGLKQCKEITVLIIPLNKDGVIMLAYRPEGLRVLHWIIDYLFFRHGVVFPESSIQLVKWESCFLAQEQSRETIPHPLEYVVWGLLQPNYGSILFRSVSYHFSALHVIGVIGVNDLSLPVSSFVKVQKGFLWSAKDVEYLSDLQWTILWCEDFIWKNTSHVGLHG